jgi:hypothetical protein
VLWLLVKDGKEMLQADVYRWEGACTFRFKDSDAIVLNLGTSDATKYMQFKVTLSMGLIARYTLHNWTIGMLDCCSSNTEHSSIRASIAPCGPRVHSQ